MGLQGFWRSGREKRRHGHGHHSFGHKHDGSVFSIDYYAYASRLRGWNPGFKALFSMVCLVLCIACDNVYVSLGTILLMGYITVVMGGLPFWRYLSLMTIPIVFLFFGSVAVALGVAPFPTGQYCVHMGFFYLYCSDESLLATLRLVARAFGAVSAMYMLTLSTPASEIIVVLRGIHVPRLIVELMNMIYRYIFLMMDTQCRMKNAAESRLGYCDFKTSCISFGQVAGNLLVVSLKKGNAYYQALEARCYDGELRFLEEEKAVTAGQTAIAVVSVAALLTVWRLTA
ncbi:MAG TPA: cobalt ECF transporter T component CbiQ [Lachnospiraceae bacterium]|nr:cobalt ECF transporter T component CbiQ [Lachnospiraceae bacterium]